jgi:hypothetical protein
MKLKVTDTKTGKVWIDDNESHHWQDLCVFIMKRHKEFNNLVYCDIECLARNTNEWFMLDECGNYEPMPDEFKVEEVKED